MLAIESTCCTNDDGKAWRKWLFKGNTSFSMYCIIFYGCKNEGNIRYSNGYRYCRCTTVTDMRFHLNETLLRSIGKCKSYTLQQLPKLIFKLVKLQKLNEQRKQFPGFWPTYIKFGQINPFKNDFKSLDLCRLTRYIYWPHNSFPIWGYANLTTH